jgi:methionyl-tRNA synthetase
MSKSRGTGIDPLKYLSLGMNPEWLRYYIAAKLNARVEDVDFNPEDFVARVNSDLVGKYINIASRAARFINSKFDGELISAPPNFGIADWTPGQPLPELTTWLSDGELRYELAQLFVEVRDAFERREFSSAIRQVMSFADSVNEYFDSRKPWELAKDPVQAHRVQEICTVTLFGFRAISVFLSPILPNVTSRVAREFFGMDRNFFWDDVFAAMPARIRPYQHLMQRVDPKLLDALFEPPVVEAPKPGG